MFDEHVRPNIHALSPLRADAERDTESLYIPSICVGVVPCYLVYLHPAIICTASYILQPCVLQRERARTTGLLTFPLTTVRAQNPVIARRFSLL